MNKKVKICSAAMGIMCIFTNSMFFGLPGYQGALDRIKNTKVLDMSFDGNNNKNSVTNKNYASLSSTHKYISSEKGNGYEVNGSKIKIPIKDLSLVADDKIVTVSFLFKWDGEDNIIPISIDGTKSKYSLWLNGTKFGFTTGNNDCYGFNHGFVKDKYYSIVAKFNFSDTSKSAIYVETLAKTLTLSGTKIDVGTISESGNVTLGGLSNSTVNDIKKKSAIDEVKIYKKDLSSDEVGAVSKAHMVPNLSSTRKDNNVTLEWTSEILTDNLIWSSGYELEEQPNINLLYDAKNGMGTGGQIFSNEAYTGSYSLMTPKTRPDKGNWKFYPYTVSTELNHVYYLGKTITFKNTDNISISYRIKADAAAKVRIMADWKFEKHFTSYGVTTTQKAVKGATVLHVSDPSKFKYDMRIAFDKDPNVIQEDLQRRVQSVDVEAKTIKLTSGIPYDLPANTELFFRDTRWAFDDSTKNIEASPEWQLINFNTGISKSNYIDWSEYAIPLRQSWSSDGNVYIDDLKVGYATRTKLYKNDIVVYDGYGNSYKDTGLTDTTAPNAVNNIKINGTNNSNKISLNIGFDAATDNGTDYRYNISAVDKNGVETPLSESIVHNVKSDIKGYSYVIDTNATTVPDNTVDTTGTSITKDLDLTNSTYYLHIKSIDNAGNVSNTVHTKIDIATLTATSLGSSNSIRLDWTIDDYANKVFDVYRKKAGDTAYSKSTSASGANTYTDTGAKDLAKPNSPTVKSITSSSNAFSINLIKPDDNGTGYTFYINSKNSDGSIVTQSNVTSEVKVTSGIKGYSYVVDTNATTNPDTTVDSTSETISVSKTTSNNIYYLHVRAIDNAGNASDTVHTKIDVATLTATSLGASNSIRLDWTIDDYANKVFDVYRKKAGDTAYSKSTSASGANTYTDTGAKDLAKPNSPTVKSMTSSNSAFSISLNKPDDNGTGYTFYINSKNSDGSVITQSNVTSEVKVTSGIKGYSYVVDTNATTNPDNTVDSTIETISVSKTTSNNVYYLHVKAIDNAGNVSDTVHIKIDVATLTATSLGKDNGVKLTWTVDNTANKSFKIYQKQSDKSNFDYIATTTSSPYNNYEAKDLAAPDSPAVKLGESSSTQLKFNIYKPKDYGTAYDFYITSETIDGIVKTQSNIVSNIDVTSGIKGYSYILDEKETTIPGNTVNHTTEELTISNVTVGKIYYLHIKAIDNAGNGSKVTHLKINTSKPLAPELVLSREGWGKDDVSFEIKQQHTKNFSIASITRYTRKSYITKLKSLGYNITEKPNCTDVNELLAYDLVIYDADCGWVENNSVLKQLYDKGAKIITIGNDSSSSIYPILGAVNVDSSYDLTINRTVKNEATFSMPSYVGGRDNSSNLITSVVPEAKILYKQKIDGNPAIIEIENEFGGKWIHSQKILGLNDTENTDELSMGLIDYMMDSISQFHITDVQYSIDNGEWTSYNGGNIPVTKEGLHTISVRNVDNRGVYSEVVTKTVGIDRTAPYFTAVAPSTTELRSVTISLKGIGDSLSGVKDVRVSNYSDFRDSNGYTSVLGQTSFDLPVTIPFFEDLNLNYSVRTIYIELFDKAGNSKVIECTTKYEPKAPQIPVITSPESNKLYVTGEKVNVSWTYNDINNDGVSLPQSKAEITFANNTTGKIYSYTSNGTERDFSISSLNDGVYSVTVTVYNSFGKSSTSAPVKFRYNIFEPEGYVLSKTIALRYPMKYVNVISSVDIPKNTTVKGYIYYAVSPTDNFTDNKRVEFNINNRLTVKNTIILPEKASKIMIKWNLYSQDKNKNISPSIDDITVYGR